MIDAIPWDCLIHLIHLQVVSSTIDAIPWDCLICLIRLQVVSHHGIIIPLSNQTIKETCRQYNNAFSIHQLTDAVSKMEESDKNKALLVNPDNLLPISELTLGSTFDTSRLTETSTNTLSVSETTTTLTTLVIATTTEMSRKKGGRPKGSTVKARKERTSKMKEIIVEAATLIINTHQGEADGKLVRHGYKQISELPSGSESLSLNIE
jgi:hypothetical protein